MPILRDIQLLVPNNRQINEKFFSETRCIASLYSRLLPNLKLPNDSGVVINCVKSLADINNQDITPYIIIDYIPVFVEVDMSLFFSLSNDRQKKEYALNIIQEGMSNFAEKYNYDQTIFDNVYQNILKADFKNVVTLNKKSSPNRKYTCNVFYQHEVSYIDVYIEIRKNRGKEMVNKERIFRCQNLDEQYLINDFGKLSWTLNHKVEFSHYRKPNERYTVTFLEKDSPQGLYWKSEKSH